MKAVKAMAGLCLLWSCLLGAGCAVPISPAGSGGPSLTPSSRALSSSVAMPAPASGSSSASTATLHDPCHQGGITYCALNPAVTQATIRQTICVSGWTATVRPPVSYTEPLKEQQIAAERLTGGVSSYEEDHRMPLELGGSPSDPTNLSPEYPRSPNPKDSDETRLKDGVCRGALTLVQAQGELVATWLAAYPGYRSQP